MITVKSERSGFRQCRNPNKSQFGFQTFGSFGTHIKRSDFGMFGFQTVSEIRALERVPLASKWLATGFFGFVLTLPHLSSLNK